MPREISPETMYQLLVQGVKDHAIYMLDPDGVVLNWNAGAERNKGYAASEIVGQNYSRFYSSEDQLRGIPRKNLEIALRSGHLTTEGYRYRKNGTAFWASVAIDPIHDEDGELVGFAKITRDLSEQRESARLLAYQNCHDALTGILNRTGLIDELEEQLPQIIYGSAVAVHYLDLDRFKNVNDSFGHPVGDAVLREAARRLEEAVGATGCVGRLGGDEFAVLQFGGPTIAAIEALSERIIQSLGRPFTVDGKTAVIGASVGIAYAPVHGSDAATLFRNADLALYRAKEEGRGCSRLFDPSMNEKALARSLMELKLRHAVDAKDFRVFYQPVVDARSSERVGFEALLRWSDQTGSDISPVEFVPLAEELGLMPDLGAWVLRTACIEAVGWAEPLNIAVNVSVTQLRDDGFVETVRQVLEETGLDPQRLELEITETAVLDNWDMARRTLGEIRTLGVGVALDDFGTGFSSLAMVKILPLTRIKIDRSFVSEIDYTPKSMAVIRSVISLCDGYGLSTTAEGVETDAQHAALVRSGCGELQGYLFGKPGAVETWSGDTAADLKAWRSKAR